MHGVEQPPTPPPWNPASTTQLVAPRLPKEAPAEDLRWRPSKKPEGLPNDVDERAQKAMHDQCHNARVPGYTGFIPGARAEDIYGHTAAHTGRKAVGEHHRRTQHRSTLNASGALPSSPPESSRRQGGGGYDVEDAHPLGKSVIGMTRSYWIPTIPGYSGYVPGKQAENICGGGIMHTAKMAGRAIVERSQAQELAASGANDMQRSHAEEAYAHFEATGDPHPLDVQRVAAISDHLDSVIPGYTGHIPRVKGESIYGATFKARNQVSALLVQDRLFNPEEHARACCNPQVPAPRRLRL